MEFLLGVTASLCATLLWQLYVRYIANQPLRGLLGRWVEEIPSSANRKYSIGEISWDRRQSKYRFDGVNYENDGQPVCRWESTSVEVDAAARRVFYTFRASFFGELNKENYGFGVLNLQDQDGVLVPVDGHYIDAKEEGTSYSHSMKPLNHLISQLNIHNEFASMEAFHSELINALHLALSADSAE